MLCAFFKALGCTILVLLSRIWTISWSSGGSFSGLLSEHVLPIEILEDTLDLLGRLRLSRLLFKSDRLMEDVSYWLFLSRTLWNFSLARRRQPAFKQLLPHAVNTPKTKISLFCLHCYSCPDNNNNHSNYSSDLLRCRRQFHQARNLFQI